MGLHLDSVGRAQNGRAVKLLIADQEIRVIDLNGEREGFEPSFVSQAKPVCATQDVAGEAESRSPEPGDARVRAELLEKLRSLTAR